MSSEQWRELTHGVIFPWHCDHYGHMNVRWYSHFFDDASFLIWSRHGVDMRPVHEQGIHTVIARSTIEFAHEMRAGDHLTVVGGFTRIGGKSVDMRFRMLDANDQSLRATQTTVAVFFDVETRRSAPIPDTVRARIEGAVLSDPEGS
jgi:acyl-CoA thioester hydrolase